VEDETDLRYRDDILIVYSDTKKAHKYMSELRTRLSLVYSTSFLLKELRARGSQCLTFLSGDCSRRGGVIALGKGRSPNPRRVPHLWVFLAPTRQLFIRGHVRMRIGCHSVAQRARILIRPNGISRSVSCPVMCLITLCCECLVWIIF
jgi:hypothetical protein